MFKSLKKMQVLLKKNGKVGDVENQTLTTRNYAVTYLLSNPSSASLTLRAKKNQKQIQKIQIYKPQF